MNLLEVIIQLGRVPPSGPLTVEGKGYSSMQGATKSASLGVSQDATKIVHHLAYPEPREKLCAESTNLAQRYLTR